MDRLGLLKQMSEFLVGVLGHQAEVVIHDIRTGEIVWIINGEVTGRSAGERGDGPAIAALAERAREKGDPDKMVGYRSFAPGGRALRSSNLFVKGDDGELQYTICVNQDITGIDAIKQYFDVLTCSDDMPVPVFKGGDTIEMLTRNIIVSEIENAKPFSLDSREVKLSILRKLDEKGVFEVRYAVPKVCEMLQMAQATLYKYLKEIRDGDGEDE